MHGILPAAGQAMRLRRLPKFLLPCDSEASTLIEKHIESMEPYCEVIWLPVRADLVPLVSDLNLGEKVIPLPLKTNTMTETVMKTAEISGSDKFLLGMPDTAFSNEYPYQRIASTLNNHTLSLALWETSPTQLGKVGSVEIHQNVITNSIDKSSKIQYRYHWGAMAFNRHYLELLDYGMSSIGYGIKICIERSIEIDYSIFNGDYFDCGTFNEYKRFINNQS